MSYSNFGEKFTSRSGIVSLMDDLGDAVASGDMIMLGGGNPGNIPAVVDKFRSRLRSIVETPGQVERLLGSYDPPDGNKAFREHLAALLNQTFDWPITADNVLLTNGSQSAFFMLFNLLGGTMADGRNKQILLPLTPEYIGYADAGLTADLFRAAKPTIEHLGPHRFKYHVDFEALRVDETVAAICASRPTNPTGNVLTDTEVRELDNIARQHNIPLIIDNAYGTPFPNIIFKDVEPHWNTNTIVCMSLSKLGLPGVRTGIVIADEPLISDLAGMNAILNLAPGNLGPQVAMELVRSADILALSEQVIKPFYADRAVRAMAVMDETLAGYRYAIHEPEGAIFLWLWFEDLPITCDDLYERLKRRGVLVISGHHFFPGLSTDWQHTKECIRVTCSQDWDSVEHGLRIIADEVKRACD